MGSTWLKADIAVRRALTRFLARQRKEAKPCSSPPRASDAPALDTGVFDELRDSLGNEPQVVLRIYRSFVRKAAASLDELRHQADAARLQSLHALKGSAGMVGANRVAELAAQLHADLQKSSPGSTEAALRELERALKEFRAALVQHLEALGWGSAL